MTRVVRGLAYGALIGALFGAVARVLMRLAALDDGTEPSFHLSDSLLIAGVFAVAGAGAGAAAAAGWRTWRLALVVVPTSFFVVFAGVGIGLGEIGTAHDSGNSALRMVVLVALALAIMALAFLTPYVGHRLGRRSALDGSPGPTGYLTEHGRSA
ncbi:MAG: hypothetical protein ABI873_17090 [Marmoricola sp.]